MDRSDRASTSRSGPTVKSSATTTGRPRSPATRKAIMVAVLAMLKRDDYGDISIEKIASKAKVSKHSIYRWWNSKGDVILDAFVEYALQQAARVEPSDDAFLDLESLAAGVYRSWHDPLFAKGLRGLAIEMSFDPGLRQRFNDAYLLPRKVLVGGILMHGVDRGQVRADLDIEAAVDLFFGFIWFHVSFDTAGVDDRATAQRLVAMLRPAFQVNRGHR